MVLIGENMEYLYIVTLYRNKMTHAGIIPLCIHSSEFGSKLAAKRFLKKAQNLLKLDEEYLVFEKLNIKSHDYIYIKTLWRK